MNLLGTLSGILAAILYTLTNIALRDCVDINAYLVSAVKAAPTVIALGPLIAVFSMKGKPIVTNSKRIPQFIAASFAAQFLGNAAFQKALEYIGLAASVPITLGVLIVGGAGLGIVMLDESVSRQKTIAMITLIAAVCVLSIPSGTEPTIDQQSNESINERATDLVTETPQPPTTVDSKSSASRVLIGSTWAALSGLAYSFFGVTMRQTLQSGVGSTAAMFISGLVGVVSLWSFCLINMGYEAIAETTSDQWITMSIAGICNFTAFIAITASLRHLPVVAVNLINASQVAMAAVAGVLLFQEPLTLTLLAGIGLTILGLLILAKPGIKRGVPK